MKKVIRIIRCYNRINDELVSEFDLDYFDLQKFQSHFSISTDNPMYDCYPIGLKDISFIEEFLGKRIKWEFVLYAYFVEADAV